MSLQLTSLEKGVSSLERSLRVAHHNIQGDVDTDLEEVVRAGVIQNFEFTYELCWKFMKRWLSQSLTPSEVDALPRKELFRNAAKFQLIHSVERWFAYHEARNQTSHTYDPSIAQDVYLEAERFLADARYLLEQLQKKP